MAARFSVSAIWRAAAEIASAPVASGSVRWAWMMLRVVGVALDLGGDPVHGRDRLDGKGAGGGLGRQHDRVGAFEDGGRDVRDLGAGRHRRGDHRFQHLRGDDHRLAGAAGGAGDLLLDAGHLLERHLDAEVAAGDHQRVGELDDRGEALDRLRLLDLGQDAGAAAGDLPDLGEILGALDEGERDPVDAGVERRLEVGAVLGGEGAEGEGGVGDADALAVGEPGADLDGGHGAAVACTP